MTYLRSIPSSLILASTLTLLGLAAACGGSGGDQSTTTSSTTTVATSSITTTCQGTDCTSQGGAGGTSTTTSPGGGSTGSGGNGTGGGSGGGAGGSTTCYPSEPGCIESDRCVCAPTETSSQEFCSKMKLPPEQGGAGMDLCPSGYNYCGNGHNRCGYDLPKDEDYVPAPTDWDSCLQYLSKSTWTDGEGNESTVNMRKPNGNGQVLLSIGLIGTPEVYDKGSILLSDHDVYWNQANVLTLYSAKGTLSPDCQTIEITYSQAGAQGKSYTLQFLHN